MTLGLILNLTPSLLILSQLQSLLSTHTYLDLRSAALGREHHFGQHHASGHRSLRLPNSCFASRSSLSRRHVCPRPGHGSQPGCVLSSRIVSVSSESWEPCEQDAGKGAQHAIAQCLAVVCCAAGQQQVVATVRQLLQTLQVGA